MTTTMTMPSFLSMDPAKTTGWSWIRTSDLLAAAVEAGRPVTLEQLLVGGLAEVWSGSGPLEELHDDLPPELLHGQDPVCIALERGYLGRGQSERSALTLFESIGGVRQWLAERFGPYAELHGRPVRMHGRMWRPNASQWRGRLAPFPLRPRSECKRAALRLATRANHGWPLVGPRGGPQEDRAEAICIGLASVLRFANGGWTW